jgi:hypothetical protein
MGISDDDLEQFAEVGRREVNPPIQVDMATWSKSVSSTTG